MTTAKEGHHHRSSLKQKNKPFKGGSGRSKSRGRVEGSASGRTSTGGKPGRTLNSVAMTKADRRNQASLAQAARRAEVTQERRIFAGKSGVPRNIVLVPLSPSVEIGAVLRSLQPSSSSSTDEITYIEEHRQRLRWLPVKFDDWSIMDQISVADVVVLVVHSQDSTDLEIRSYELLSVMRAQGISSAIGYVQHSEMESGSPLKKEARAAWTDLLTNEMASVSRVFVQSSVEGSRETAECLRALCSQKLAGISWRERRPYLLAETLQYEAQTQQLTITGFGRGGKPFSANRLVHLPGHGAFEVERISLASSNGSNDTSMMAVDTMEQVCDPSVAETLYDPEQADHDDGLDGSDMDLAAAEDMEEKIGKLEKRKKIKVKVPKGTSSYQAAWLSDVEEVTGDELEVDDNVELSGSDDQGEEDNHDEDEGMDEDDPYEREAHRITGACSTFPDRVEIPSGQTARSHLATHRGLASLRTGAWDPEEHLPVEYRQVFQFEDAARSTHKALHGPVDGPFSVGQRLSIVLKGVGADVAQSIGSTSTVLYGLLPYEQRTSLLHFLVNPRIHPLQSGEEVVAWIGGIRRFVCQPLYSEHNPSSALHRMIRTVPAGSTAVASIYCPIHYPPGPVLLFNAQTGDLLSVGSLLTGSDPRRIILQRSTLTGAPYKIQRRAAVVRWMFDNPEDVAWFKPVELTTKSGRRGNIKASVGTHGHFKALFDKPLLSNEPVALHLYKRVFPAWCTTRLI